MKKAVLIFWAISLPAVIYPVTPQNTLNTKATETFQLAQVVPVYYSPIDMQSSSYPYGNTETGEQTASTPPTPETKPHQELNWYTY